MSPFCTRILFEKPPWFSVCVDRGIGIFAKMPRIFAATCCGHSSCGCTRFASHFFSSVFNQRCWTCCSVGVVLIRGGMAAAHGKIKKKYGMENERDALFTAVEVPSLSEDDQI